MRYLTFEQLDDMHDRLFRRLELDNDDEAYVAEWDRILELAGWTWDEYLRELDARWIVERNEQDRRARIGVC